MSENECTWTRDDDLGWDTTCGQNVFGLDTPAEENGIATCQHCGKPIEFLVQRIAPFVTLPAHYLSL